MSIRLALLAAICAGASLALRAPLPEAQAIALPPPPSVELKRAPPLATLPAASLQRIAAAPPKIVAPVDPSKIPQPPVSPEALQLLGVVSGDGGAYAIIGLHGGRPQTVARGAEIGGWRLAAIGPRSVRLVRGRDTLEKTLFQPRTAGPNTPVQAPVSAPSANQNPVMSPAPTSPPPAIYAPPSPPIIPRPN